MKLLKFLCAKRGLMSPLLQKDRRVTSSPIQLHKIRGILRANRAPALVQEQLAVV
jgi:hypothetical protein